MSSSKPEGDDLLSTDMEFNGILLWSQILWPGEMCRESTASSPKPKDDDLAQLWSSVGSSLWSQVQLHGLFSLHAVLDFTVK